MKANLDEGISIYKQIQNAVEEDILSGAIAEESPIPSTNQFAKLFGINPATAAKGVSLLAEENIVYKKRGIGMYVTAGARDAILSKRRWAFYNSFIEVVNKAEDLGVGKSELIQMIQEGGVAEL